MAAYYNEHDPFAAAWLRELMADGLIAPGEVDERSIEDVRPDELAGFTQCHFFAGIGVWSLALRQAGWPDEQPVWTGSCPCQPFSAAGKGDGFADERHLWPAFYWLIAQCRPAIVLGEQVASKVADTWIDLVQADVEALGYAFGCVPFPAAGVGAPHIRDRNYWVADADHAGRQGRIVLPECADQRLARSGGLALGLAHTDGGNTGAEREQCGGEQRQLAPDGGAMRLADTLRDGARNASGCGVGTQATADGSNGSVPGQRLRSGLEGASVGMAYAECGGRQQQPSEGPASVQREAEAGRILELGNGCPGTDGERPGPTNGLWRDADWLGCTDGKWRPVEPGTFPLANAGAFRNRVALLRGAGNALTLAQAAVFIDAVIAHLSAPSLEAAE